MVSNRVPLRRLTFQRHDPGAPLLSLITTAIHSTGRLSPASTDATVTPDRARVNTVPLGAPVPWSGGLTTVRVRGQKSREAMAGRLPVMAPRPLFATPPRTAFHADLPCRCNGLWCGESLRATSVPSRRPADRIGDSVALLWADAAAAAHVACK